MKRATPNRVGADKHARALAKRIKAHLAYTVELGNLLGIEVRRGPLTCATSKPNLTGANQAGGGVKLDFDKSIRDEVVINCAP